MTSHLAPPHADPHHLHVRTLSPDYLPPTLVSPSAFAPGASPHLPTAPSSLMPVLPHSATPFHGNKRHCSFVLLAEFDILKGSVVRYQYPRPTKIKENVLAECMLPEGAHLRESDWTVSFLTNAMLLAADKEQKTGGGGKDNKKESSVSSSQKDTNNSSTTTSPVASSTAFPPPSISTSANDHPVELQESGYLCMLNLVRTKMDRTVKRGAIVKALAIVTRHRFYNIFKPLLMLTLDQYFDATMEEDKQVILVNLYHTINNMNLDMLPQISPLAARLNRAIRLRTASNPSAHDYFNTSVKWETPGVASLLTSTNAGSASVGGGNSVFNSPMTLPSSTTPASPSVPSNTASLPIRIPISMEPDEVLEASVSTLVNRFQKHIMTIYAALLTEKRVLFLGYGQPASLVCECVLSACLLISPPLIGTLNRAFPYANLVNMEFLSVPGYIAGVTNPIFESRKEWWDILCNITNGDITISQSYQEELASVGSSDSAVRMKELDQVFYQELSVGVQSRYGEEWTRCMFRDWTEHFLCMAKDEEHFVFDDLQAIQQANGASGGATAAEKTTVLTPGGSLSDKTGVGSGGGSGGGGGTTSKHSDGQQPSLLFSQSLNNMSSSTNPSSSNNPHHILPLTISTPNPTKASHMQIFSGRLTLFLRSKQCATWTQQTKLFEQQESALGTQDGHVRRNVRMLQLLASGGLSAMISRRIANGSSTDLFLRIYAHFTSVIHTRDELLEFLAMLPESRGGLFPIALGLLHADAKVRQHVVDLLQRLDSQLEGNRSVSSLNYFLLMTYYRYVKQQIARTKEGRRFSKSVSPAENDTMQSPMAHHSAGYQGGQHHGGMMSSTSSSSHYQHQPQSHHGGGGGSPAYTRDDYSSDDGEDIPGSAISEMDEDEDSSFVSPRPTARSMTSVTGMHKPISTGMFSPASATHIIPHHHQHLPSSITPLQIRTSRADESPPMIDEASLRKIRNSLGDDTTRTTEQQREGHNLEAGAVLETAGPTSLPIDTPSQVTSQVASPAVPRKSLGTGPQAAGSASSSASPVDVLSPAANSFAASLQSAQHQLRSPTSLISHESSGMTYGHFTVKHRSPASTRNPSSAVGHHHNYNTAVTDDFQHLTNHVGSDPPTRTQTPIVSIHPAPILTPPPGTHGQQGQSQSHSSTVEEEEEERPHMLRQPTFHEHQGSDHEEEH